MCIRDRVNETVLKMHADSGLLDEWGKATLSMADAEAQLLDYIKTYVPDARKAPLAGNTVGTDRAFLAREVRQLDTQSLSGPSIANHNLEALPLIAGALDAHRVT